MVNKLSERQLVRRVASGASKNFEVSMKLFQVFSGFIAGFLPAVLTRCEIR